MSKLKGKSPYPLSSFHPMIARPLQMQASGTDATYKANLLPDAVNGAVGHPDTGEIFEGFDGQRYTLKSGVFVPN